MTHVGINGRHYKEIKIICELFGDGTKPHTVLNMLSRLQAAGIVQVGGSFAEVVPPIFANRLADKAVRGRFNELLTLFASLAQAGRCRLIRRLNQVRGKEVKRFWDEIFGSTGLFKDFPTALKNLRTLRYIASTTPIRVLKLIQKGLENMSRADRLSIVGNVRRDLMWTLEELLFRNKTSAGAIICLALLAEAETEDYGNNATEVFCESFFPRHIQIPLPLQDRLSILTNLFLQENSTELQLVGIKAIQSGLERHMNITLRRSIGGEPLDSPPPLTYGEIWNYLESLFDLLMEIAVSENNNLSIPACEALAESITDFAFQVSSESALKRLNAVIDGVLMKRMAVPVARLTEALRFVYEAYERRLEKSVGETSEKIQQVLDNLDHLIRRIDESDFSFRLKRWTGGWTQYGDYELDEEGKRISRLDKEIRELVKEVLEKQNLINEQLIGWLCSEQAKTGHYFFWWLGKLDSDKSWFAKILDIGNSEIGSRAFASYMGGLQNHAHAWASSKLDEVTSSGEVRAEAIVEATGYLGGDLAGVIRMETLILQDRVDPVYVEKVLRMGGWIKSLKVDEYLRLLRAIAGQSYKNGSAVIDFFGMWLHYEKPVEGELSEFACQCLELASDVSSNDHYNFDRLASKLAHSDPKRGFSLLQVLISQPHTAYCWQPISRYGQNEFWNFLMSIERERALRLVLSAVSEDQFKRISITGALSEAVDQVKDSDILISLAFEAEAQAELISECITSGRPGFWPIALKIAERYPDNRDIKSALMLAIEQIGRVNYGAWSVHIERCRREIEEVIKDDATPQSVLPWLKELEASFRKRAEQELLSEADEEVNDLMAIIDDSDAPERLWVVETLLNQRKTEDLLRLFRLLDKEELRAIFKKLQVPEAQIEDILKKIVSQN